MFSDHLINYAIPLAGLFIITGCSNKAIYDNIQLINRVECGSLPLSQYEECVERNSKPYDVYNRERRQVE